MLEIFTLQAGTSSLASPDICQPEVRMTRARGEQICLDAAPYYHVVSRCVRRAFLCGDDAYSQRNFDHRRQWVVDRLQQLCHVFAVDMAAYTVMSNHYHLVLGIDQEEALAWPSDEVIERWYTLFSGHLLVDRLKGVRPWVGRNARRRRHSSNNGACVSMTWAGSCAV
jgi:hypothetical protein